MADAERVYIVPEGSLHLVTIDALPDADDRYLLESSPVLHTLSTERDLVADPPRATSDPARGPLPTAGRTASLLAVGGPDFDVELDVTSARAAGAAVARLYRGSRSACDDPLNLRFLPLPGAATETAMIAAIYGRQGSDHRAVVAMGSEATEAMFKREASGRAVVHVATHGFVLHDGCGANFDSGQPPWSITSSSGRGAPRTLENPLLSAGLALAGANRRATNAGDGEDGILTGEEIAALELGGTQWIVLSACDTGTGGVSPGEGVFGLRRAFQVAGARTLITSLWSVEDEDALEWMRRLYTERFERQLPTVDAARAASLGMLQAARSRGNGAHPFHWAAFLATGDWR
jgi:CHAT domain-containing protein